MEEKIRRVEEEAQSVKEERAAAACSPLRHFHRFIFILRSIFRQQRWRHSLHNRRRKQGGFAPLEEFSLEGEILRWIELIREERKSRSAKKSDRPSLVSCLSAHFGSISFLWTHHTIQRCFPSANEGTKSKRDGKERDKHLSSLSRSIE